METESHRKKPHYAWYILISCIAFYGATMGILINTQGIFMPPILKDLGWSATQYSATGIISGLVSVVTLLFVDKVYRKFPTKWVIFFSVLIYAAGFFLKGYTDNYIYYCGVCALLGVGAAFVLYVPAPMLINAWFQEKKGFAIGICMLSSGIAGAIMNPIVSALIESMGWRNAVRINSAIAAVIACPIVLIIVRKSPEDMGLLPYGATRPALKPGTEGAQSHGKAAQEFFNNRYSGQEKRNKFIICLILATMLNLLSCVSSHLANFASSLGLAAAIGATLTTSQMLGNLSSKAVMGVCMDKFGKKKTLLISMILVSAAYFGLGFNGGIVVLLFVCAFFLGITAAHNTIVMPAMVETYAIGDEYTKIISKVSMGAMLASAFSGLITSGLYDLTGSYAPVWILYGLLEIICIVLLLRFYKERATLHLHRSGRNIG